MADHRRRCEGAPEKPRPPLEVAQGVGGAEVMNWPRETSPNFRPKFHLYFFVLACFYDSADISATFLRDAVSLELAAFHFYQLHVYYKCKSRKQAESLLFSLDNPVAAKYNLITKKGE